ncbi:MAG: efflux RND transporter periplasmic adaptor subunit [Anaerolineae bacterium]
MKRAIPIFILLILIGAGYFWWTTQSDNQAISLPAFIDPAWGKETDNPIVGSGSIEAEMLAITTETGGRIVAMHADEGDVVQRGDLLVELDTSLLEASQTQLQAALDTARAHLAEVRAGPRPEEIAAAQAELLQAEAARDGAYAVWQQAQSIVEQPLELQARIDTLRGDITVLEKQVEAAQADLKAAQIQRDEAARNQSNDEAITLSQVAVKVAQAAQANLAAAEAELAGAKRQLALLIAIRNNPLALITQANAARVAWEQAEAGVSVAEARLASVKAGPMPEEIAIAEAQVQQAGAALASLQVQLDKRKLTAPRDGVILSRPAEPGELANPGATLMSLGDLDRVTLTVFIPETQIGRVRVGQTAYVEVDAYPGETFEGRVTFIAPEAEFTPKNVQTREERVNLVFAVKIALDNAGHRLKPGMPADAEIISGH